MQINFIFEDVNGKEFSKVKKRLFFVVFQHFLEYEFEIGITFKRLIFPQYEYLFVFKRCRVTELFPTIQ
jgi:hypothetical protein